MFSNNGDLINGFADPATLSLLLFQEKGEVGFYLLHKDLSLSDEEFDERLR